MGFKSDDALGKLGVMQSSTIATTTLICLKNIMYVFFFLSKRPNQPVFSDFKLIEKI